MLKRRVKKLEEDLAAAIEQIAWLTGEVESIDPGEVHDLRDDVRDLQDRVERDIDEIIEEVERRLDELQEETEDRLENAFVRIGRLENPLGVKEEGR
jgi:chromosome segregation ATPase